MKIRVGLIIVFCLSFFLVACGSDTSEDDEIIKLRANHSVDESHSYHLGLVKFKEIVEEELPDKVKVEVYHSGQLGTEGEALEGMQDSSLEMAIATSGPVSSIIPRIGVFDLPYLFPDRESAHELFDGEIGDKYNDLLLEKDIVNLGWFENGFRQITNSKHPIENPDDLKGIKIRVLESQVAVDSFNMAGADATPMDWGEVFTALQQGTIDAQENPFPVIYSHGLDEVQDYLTISNHNYSAGLLMIGEDTFDRFSDEEKKILRKAGQEATKYQREVNQEQNEEYLELLKETMEVSEIDMEEFKEAFSPVYDSYRDENGSEDLDEILGE